jgi:Na+-translocating ferredoxin:NAD+ oxidoreductase subunit B
MLPRSPSGNAGLAERIDALLPQTQCTKCGYPACRDYAEAVAAGAASHNQCPPGGAAGIQQLAALLGKPVLPLNPQNGHERPRPVALIDESLCIGCTLCIQACPVDAIVGAAKQMHTVIAELCTGCDLCVAPCPVDCIAMVDVTPGRSGWQAWSRPQAEAARQRFISRSQRLQREARENEARLAAKAATKLQELRADTPQTAAQQTEAARKKAIIEAAIERARVRQEQMAAHSSATPPHTS